VVPTLMPPSSALHAWVLQHPFSASIVVTALCWPVCGCTTAILSGVASVAILCCLSNYSTPSANAARSLAASSSASIIDGSRRLIARIPTSAPIRAESCYICDTSWQRSFIGMTDVVVAGQPQWFCIQVRDADNDDHAIQATARIKRPHDACASFASIDHRLCSVHNRV